MVELSLIHLCTVSSGHTNGGRTEGSFLVKSGLAQMSKGGVIMDVVTAEQAKIAEEAGVRKFKYE